jgi:hypothetical protein
MVAYLDVGAPTVRGFQLSALPTTQSVLRLLLFPNLQALVLWILSMPRINLTKQKAKA